MICRDGAHSRELFISRLDGAKIAVLIADLLLVMQAHGENQALPGAFAECAQESLGARCPLASRFFSIESAALKPTEWQETHVYFYGRPVRQSPHHATGYT